MTLISLLTQAEQAYARGDLAGSERHYRDVLQQAPDCHAAYHGLGLIALAVGNIALAMQLLERAVRLGEAVALYHRNLCEVARRAGALDRAMAAGRRAVKLEPKNPEGHYNLGLAQSDAGQLEDAIKSYRRAVRRRGEYGLAWNNLGAALEANGDKRAAKTAYTRAVALNHNHAEAQNNLGALAAEDGDIDTARASFEAAVKARPGFVDAHYNLSTLKSYSEADPDVATLEALATTSAVLGEPDRVRLHFALGKAREDVGRYDDAFAAYQAGNTLHHARHPEDEVRAERLMRDIVTLFEPEFCRQRRGTCDEQRVPLFIVGMPRSGTTLMEQILASHPAVRGAGELKDLEAAVSGVCGADAHFNVGALAEADVGAIGRTYLDRVWRQAPQARFVTDKMPANFAFIGLIQKALPQARIIHAQRDPLDSCFSCYSRHFKDAMNFTYDLGVLGRYYQRYMALMRHWHTVLEPGRILNVHYENVVADLETETRRLLDYCGLPWDARCLDFHHNKRRVLTASAAQVRRPLYTSSVARWQRFESHLAPLAALVGHERENGRARE